MTTYTITGTLKDSENQDVNVGESTSRLARFQQDVYYYTRKENGFKGTLMVVRQYDNGVTDRSYINI